MCGINGFNFGDQGLIESMIAATRHRGPDDEGLYVDDNVSLGHNRLSIIDLSERGHQPMCTFDKKLWIVFNGEIYNFQEIREDLEHKGYQFRSDSDTEVILYAYREYGEECVSHFNGMFAFAIWDSEKKELFLARDRLGEKPLFYFFDGKRFIFSSEIKGILRHNVERKIDLEAFNHYLRLLYIPAPLTIYQGIRKLRPAHYMKLKSGKLEIKRYWEVSDFEDFTNRDEAIAEVRRLFDDSVRRRLIADREVGIFLSGGVDSTSVLAQMKELKKDKIRTFSVGFDTDIEWEKFNQDFEQARWTAQHFGTQHNELLTSCDDVIRCFDVVLESFDEPMANSNQASMFLLSKMAKAQVAVVLGGDGGDELFGGYDKYRLNRIISRYQFLPMLMRKAAKPLIKAVFGRRATDPNHVLNLPASEERYLHFAAEHTIDEVLKPEFLQNEVTVDFFKRQFFDKPVSCSFDKKMMLTDLETWVADETLVHSDRMTMASGLEYRVPFLDHRLVELSMKIPMKWKLRHGQTKWILRQALKDLLPAEILRKPKSGWNAPVAKWLRAGLKDFAYDHLSRASVERAGFFEYEKVRLMLDDHVSKKRYNAQSLWMLINFQAWHEKYFG